MSFGYNSISPLSEQNPKLSFCSNNSVIDPNAPLAKPIEKVQKSIEGTVNSFAKTVDEEKNKTSNKTAIAVGSSVLVLSALVAVLNPRYSSKLAKRMQSLHHKTGAKVDRGKQGFFKSSFYKVCSKAIGWGMKGLEFSNNFNTAKDLIFKDFCTKKKDFSVIKNRKTRKVLKSIDKAFIGIMRKPYNAITKWFDNISKKTVSFKYKQASKSLNSFEEKMVAYKSRLSADQQKVFDLKLAEALKLKDHFSNEKLSQRFVEQERAMSDLETKFWKRVKTYRHGFSNKWKDKGSHIGKNMTFWAEEIMMDSRNKIQTKGVDVVDSLVGNSKDKKGVYHEVLEILKPSLSVEEFTTLEKNLAKSSQKLRKANYSECVEYFDKKRDLVLGSAPTDVVTALGGLGLSGVLIATADSRQERESRLLTSVFPIVAGLGASMAFTAMLFSGVQGLLLGGLTSIGLSKLGSMADKYILGNENNSNNDSVKVQEKLYA